MLYNKGKEVMSCGSQTEFNEGYKPVETKETLCGKAM